MTTRGLSLAAALVAAPVLAEGPQVSGFIDATYNRTLNASTARENVHHSFDQQGNTFLLNAVHLALSGGEGQAVSYTVEVDAGTDAAAASSAGLGPGDDVDLQEAYVTHAMGGSTLTITAGKFVTFEGIELIESIDNPTITRGFLFGLAEPFTHTGITASYQASPRVQLVLGAVNGWDLWVDNNDAPTGVAKVGLDFGEPLRLGLSGYLGPEQAGREGDLRTSLDLTGVAAAVPGLDLWFQVNHGSEAGAAADGGDASWFGLGVQPVYRVSDRFTLGARYEWFDDGDGARTGVAQTLQNLTVTPGYQLTDALLARAEVRADLSDADVFLDADDEPTGTQLQVAAEVIFSF